MTTVAEVQTTQVYNILIKATPEAIWDAITKPEFTSRYFHGVHVRTTLAPGTPFLQFAGDLETLVMEGEVLESDPPRRLSHTWLARYDDEMAREEPSRVTWEIEPQENGTTLLTVVHDRLAGAPKTAAGVSGIGWMGVLSSMKTLLETGEPLA
jgi:uncharacterized protein YndB with AHSA1/START domain